MTWQEKADCRTEDGDWDLEPHARTSAANRVALAVCAECPVRLACLTFALTTERPWPRWGIWGGATPGQREYMARSGRDTADQTA